jgi:acetylornithine/N-succinyldiaminopimelate aminotransferase
MKLYDVYSLYPVTPVKGQGAYVYDDKGQKYLDLYGGHAVISIGHSHPHYVKTISEQLQKLGFYSNSIVNPLQQELADKLEKASNISGYDLFLINSGAEANDNALKLASFYNGRKKIIALENSFHGRTSAAINVTHTGKKHQAPINHGVDVIYFHYQDIDGIIEEITKAESAGIIIENIQGVGGLDSISHDNLRAITAACHHSDTILIMDEVQCGYGRSGDFFAFQAAGINPDIITTAKGMGNGFPIGGVLINSNKIPPVSGQLGTTYGGSHLACAAGIAVLDVIDSEHLISNAKTVGTLLSKILQNMPGVKQIKGRGLMLGAEFEFPVAALRKSLVFNHQVFTGSSSNPNLLRILPPLNINENHVDEFQSKLSKALEHHLAKA